mmetsp:Transcript_2607/g.6229  ORF Transcript_2607/g.6229 Transcript_2607/m.6229 type:complete len:171 (-) Transcript_2607:97-609(-)
MCEGDLGSHSIRKGSVTYCTSGSTACPGSATVCLRAGWKMGTIQDTYLRYEAAGDMHVGRTVSGLPILHPDFASLPPCFKFPDTESREEVTRILNLMFPSMRPGMNKVAEQCLASLVFHAEFLRKELPRNHAIFDTFVFSQTGVVDKLLQFVTTASDGSILITGVPPHVA